MYLIVSDETLAVILVRETLTSQSPRYYISKALHKSKLNYSQIEKLAYALFMASYKFKQYF